MTVKHIRFSETDENNSCITFCKENAKEGEWVAGATYQGMQILKDKTEFCVTCVRAWIKFINK